MMLGALMILWFWNFRFFMFDWPPETYKDHLKFLCIVFRELHGGNPVSALLLSTEDSLSLEDNMAD